jgi:flagellar protein FlaI
MLVPLQGDRSENIVDEYSVLASFGVGDTRYEVSAKVVILDERERYRYYVVEPYSHDVRDAVWRLIEVLKGYIEFNDDFFNDPINTIYSIYESLIRRRRFGERLDIELGGLGEALRYYLVKNYLGYGDLTFVIADDNVEDVSCSGPDTFLKIWHKRYNDQGWVDTNIYVSGNELDRLISKFTFRCGKNINIVTPVMEGVLPEGYRVVATWKKEVSPKGSSFTIRKYRSRPYTLTELIRDGLLSSDIAAYLWRLIEKKRLIMIIGSSGVGKTTLLNALAHLIHPNYKVISIEDVQEIHLPYHSGWKPFVTRTGDFRREYSIYELLRIALRERADYILLGESRGVEARLIFQGAATGHGCITTFHASSLDELLARLRSKPISLDESMVRLIDTVVILNFFYDSSLVVRRVESVYRQVDGRWHKLYGGSVSDLLSPNVHLLEDLDMSELNMKVSFLDHLVSIDATDPRELLDRLVYYYKGFYKYSRGRWVLANV